MIVYQTNNYGYFIREITLDESDKNPKRNDYIIPGGCVKIKPPSLTKNEKAKWDGEKWNIEVVDTATKESKPRFIPRYNFKQIANELGLLENFNIGINDVNSSDQLYWTDKDMFSELDEPLIRIAKASDVDLNIIFDSLKDR